MTTKFCKDLDYTVATVLNGMFERHFGTGGVKTRAWETDSLLTIRSVSFLWLALVPVKNIGPPFYAEWISRLMLGHERFQAIKVV